MDTMTKAQRSRHMAGITGDNLKPEKRLAEQFDRMGEMHYVRNVETLPGRPDFLVGMRDSFRPRGWVAVFVHGCFWHRCPRHGGAPKTNKVFWRRKLDGNAARDARVRRQLRRLGYRTMVVWEHDLGTLAQAFDAAWRIKRRLCR